MTSPVFCVHRSPQVVARAVRGVGYNDFDGRRVAGAQVVAPDPLGVESGEVHVALGPVPGRVDVAHPAVGPEALLRPGEIAKGLEASGCSLRGHLMMTCDSLHESHRNWPFSRVGVSTNCSWVM